MLKAFKKSILHVASTSENIPKYWLLYSVHLKALGATPISELTSSGEHHPSARQHSPAWAPRGRRCRCHSLDTHSFPAHLTRTWDTAKRCQMRGWSVQLKMSLLPHLKGNIFLVLHLLLEQHNNHKGEITGQRASYNCTFLSPTCYKVGYCFSCWAWKKTTPIDQCFLYGYL